MVIIPIQHCLVRLRTQLNAQVNPDEFYVFKPTLEQDKNAVVGRTLGSKKVKMVYAKEVTSYTDGSFMTVEIPIESSGCQGGSEIVETDEAERGR
eukprot:133067-Amorphochlora_amoeboformis.AAC.1